MTNLLCIFSLFLNTAGGETVKKREKTSTIIGMLTWKLEYPKEDHVNSAGVWTVLLVEECKSSEGGKNNQGETSRVY